MLSSLYRLIQEYRRGKYIKSLVSRGLKLGDNVEIIADFFFDPSHCFLISIGDNCTICPNVRLIAHDASIKKLLGFTKLGLIKIGNDCFVGDSVIILPGVTIGDGAIIGAGSLVTKDIPPGMVAVGRPARIVCKVSEYIEKYRQMSSGKRIFGEKYFINNIDEKGQTEMLDEMSSGAGFIV